jgi:hypothetical protein
MTFVAAPIAVAGIWWQICSANARSERQLKVARENLDHQINSDREARNRERARQKRTLIKAFQAEISALQDFVVKNVKPAVRNFGQPDFRAPKVIPILGDSSFAVFKSNSQWLGEFHPDAATAVLEFYAHAAVCFGAARDFQSLAQEEVSRHGNLPHDGAAYRSLMRCRG